MGILSGDEPFRVPALELQPATGPGEVGTKFPVYQLRQAVKEHLLDADVIMKVFDVTQRPGCAGGMSMLCGRAVRRKRNVVCLAQRRNLQEAGDSATAGRVGLQHIYRARFE